MNESRSWFEDWFDTGLYYELYASRNDTDASRLLDCIQPFLPEKPARVMDLACGRGRHALNLARRGYEVTGVDLSAKALEFGKRRSEHENLGIRFVRADMRDVLPSGFDAVVNLFTSFGYFETESENGLVLKRISDALNPGGRFVIDFLNPLPIKRHLISEELGVWSGGSFTISRKIDEPVVEKEINILYAETGRTQVFRERVALLTPEWFQQSGLQHGLELVGVLGDYNGNPFNSAESPRFIGIFQKTAPLLL